MLVARFIYCHADCHCAGRHYSKGHGAISKEYCLVGKRADGDKSFGFCAGHQLNLKKDRIHKTSYAHLTIVLRVVR
jgi:hypothetical protein